MTEKNSDYWIALARRAGSIARESTHRAWALERIAFPRALAVLLGARADGTLTAARRAFSVGVTEGLR